MEISEYFAQYRLTYVPNPSDESDFEETSYEFDEKPNYSRLRREACKKMSLSDEENERGRNAQLYLEKWQDIQFEKTIFNLSALEINLYTHEKIKMTFIPSRIKDFTKGDSAKIIIKDYICCHRKYKISLKYIKDWKMWVLDKWEVPCKDDVMELFKKKVTDEKLEETIFHIYIVLKKHTQILARYRKYRKDIYLCGENIVLTEDEELLFLSKEEIQEKRRKEEQIWQRMIPPENKEIKLKKRTVVYLSENESEGEEESQENISMHCRRRITSENKQIKLNRSKIMYISEDDSAGEESQENISVHCQRRIISENKQIKLKKRKIVHISEDDSAGEEEEESQPNISFLSSSY